MSTAECAASRISSTKQLSHHANQFPSVRVAGEVVVDTLGLAAGADQTGVAQLLQVLGGVGYGQARDCGQHFYATRTLGKEFEQFQSVGVGESLSDTAQFENRRCLSGAVDMGAGSCDITFN